MQRAAGDRLLVATAYRPLERRHAAWQRIVDAEGRVIRLEGLDAAAVAELVRSLAPDAPEPLAERLREHTAGNPLHIRALLREHPAPELAALAARGELPAPAELAARMDARVARLDPDAARLLHALAVLGDTWSDIGAAAAIGGVHDADAALAVLRDEGLVRIDRAAVVPRIRIFHAVIRAAVYDGIPLAQRRRLHGAAAARLPAAGDRLLHRVAASAAPDEGLARDLEAHADALHEREQYREAARFLRQAAHASADPREAERRSLDASFEAILAHDLDDAAHVAAGAEESPQRRVVAAQLLAVTKDWVRAARLLDPLTDDAIAALSPRNAYRARVLRGWSFVATGRDPRTALPDLEVARASAVQDSAMRAPLTFGYGQAQAALTGAGDLWGFESERGTDRVALAASAAGLVRLSWRGSVYALTGMSREAIDDLSLVAARISDGTIDFGDGVMHSLLGFAQWIAGEWRRASISIGLPLVSPLGAPHPVAVAVTPLAAVVEGKPIGPAIAGSRAARIAGPLPAAVHAGTWPMSLPSPSRAPTPSGEAGAHSASPTSATPWRRRTARSRTCGSSRRASVPHGRATRPRSTNAPAVWLRSREATGVRRPSPGCALSPSARAASRTPTRCSRWARFRASRRSKRCCGRMPRPPRRPRRIQPRSGRARRPRRPCRDSARACTRHACCPRPRTLRPPTRWPPTRWPPTRWPHCQIVSATS